MHLCQTCCKHLPIQPKQPSGESSAMTATDDSTTADNNSNDDFCCFVCLGLWSHAESFRATVKTAVETALEPYHCQERGINRFECTKSPPVLSLPCDLLHRFQSVSNVINTNTNNKRTNKFRAGATQRTHQQDGHAGVFRIHREGKGISNEHDLDDSNHQRQQQYLQQYQ